MKPNSISYLLLQSYLIFCILIKVNAQTTSPVQHIFPQGTITYSNIPYSNDTLTKHMLDLYLPPDTKNNLPLVVWIHGGATMNEAHQMHHDLLHGLLPIIPRTTRSGISAD